MADQRARQRRSRPRFIGACTLERAIAIATEQGFPPVAIVSYRNRNAAFRGSRNFVGGTGKAVIKLLRPGEMAEPLDADQVVYVDAATRSLEHAVFAGTSDVALADSW